ncbi:MAG: hypothetical protein ACJAX5_001929 [Patiriisocius sp.]|jgi:hypothetical protein
MSERTFYSLWQSQVAGQAPFELALQGGELAETCGQIFIAGYQAAVRQTFPEIECSGWCCFAVTEDRGDDVTFPSVTIAGSKVSGFKTWIAAADCVDLLVLKVGNGDGALYGSVLADDPGVTIQSRPGRFLADMSQGAAEFKNATFQEFSNVSRVREFRRIEPYYIYVAFLARLSSLDNGVSDMALRMLKQQAEESDVVGLDAEVSRLLGLMEQQAIELGDQWETDKRLLTMYSKSIRG